MSRFILEGNPISSERKPIEPITLTAEEWIKDHPLPPRGYTQHAPWPIDKKLFQRWVTLQLLCNTAKLAIGLTILLVCRFLC
jgi:hypothetical protein